MPRSIYMVAFNYRYSAMVMRLCMYMFISIYVDGVLYCSGLGHCDEGWSTMVDTVSQSVIDI